MHFKELSLACKPANASFPYCIYQKDVKQAFLEQPEPPPACPLKLQKAPSPATFIYNLNSLLGRNCVNCNQHTQSLYKNLIYFQESFI